VTVIARFDRVKLGACAAAGVLALMVAVWLMLKQDAGYDGRRPWQVWVLVELGFSAFAAFTGVRILRWKGPALAIADGHIRAFGLRTYVPLTEVEDIRTSVSATTSESWNGVIVYRHGKPLVRIQTWFLEGSRETICRRLRSAVGLTDSR